MKRTAIDNGAANCRAGQSSARLWPVLALIPLAIQLTGCLLPGRDEAALSAFLESRMKALGAVGLSVGVMRGEDLVWSGSWGLADREGGAAASADTVYRICSISKSITGLAAMVLVDRGKLDLDADISTYLRIRIRNPSFPDTPITARMLMSHTSSLIDDWTWLQPLTLAPEPAMSLEQFVTTCITKESWLKIDPGATPVYSNTGVTVLARVVESICGVPFQDWTADVIFGPAGISDAAWFETSMTAGVAYAHPYGFNGSPIAQWRVPQWPAGSLLCSVRSFAPLAAIFVNRGVVKGTRIVSQSSLEEMERVAAGHFGLSVEVPVNHPDKPQLRGHFGDMPGFHTGFLYDPAARFGVFYFANGEFDHTLLRAEIESALIAAARDSLYGF